MNIKKIISALRYDDLLLIIIFLFIIIIILRIKLAQDKLFKTTPIGESRDYIVMILPSIGFAVTFTNIDNKNMEFKFGFFKIRR